MSPYLKNHLQSVIKCDVIKLQVPTLSIEHSARTVSLRKKWQQSHHSCLKLLDVSSSCQSSNLSHTSQVYNLNLHQRFTKLVTTVTSKSTVRRKCYHRKLIYNQESISKLKPISGETVTTEVTSKNTKKENQEDMFKNKT